MCVCPLCPCFYLISPVKMPPKSNFYYFKKHCNIILACILSRYLFDNNKITGEQQYDRIVNDIRSPLMEEGYSIYYVTGHR